MALTYHERLEIFFERLRISPPTSTVDESLDLISRLLKEVEDQFSGVPENPNPGLKRDGRMYPPRKDRILPASDYSEVQNPQDGDVVAQTVANYVLLCSDGRIVIYDKQWKIKFSK